MGTIMGPKIWFIFEVFPSFDCGGNGINNELFLGGLSGLWTSGDTKQCNHQTMGFQDSRDGNWKIADFCSGLWVKHLRTDLAQMFQGRAEHHGGLNQATLEARHRNQAWKRDIETIWKPDIEAAWMAYIEAA